MNTKENTILFFPERSVDPETGYVAADAAGKAVNIEPVRVYAGTILRWLDKEAVCRIFFYNTEIDEDWVHTFCYEPESNWALYDRAMSETGWSNEDRIFEKDGYIRIVMQTDPGREPRGIQASDPGMGMRQPESLSMRQPQPGFLPESLFRLEHPGEAVREQAQIRPFFLDEAEQVSRRLAAVREPGDLVFFLMTDTHYTVNGNWDETAKNVRHMAELCHPDFAVHLGDLTDGLLPGALTRQYSGRILDTLHDAAGPVYCCLGNHDSNYAGNNPERFTADESAAWYLQYAEGYQGGRPAAQATAPAVTISAAASPERVRDFYMIDDSSRRLRFLFLSSFDCERETENDRYVYSEEECRWLRDVLNETPPEYGVLVFSHVPLLPEMHVWSDGIHGSSEVLQILEDFQRQRHALLAYFHGHNHCDQIERKHAFPIVAIGSGKLESFPEKKPAGAICYERERGTASQDLWDVVRVSRDHHTIDLIRFGAGEDRRLDCRPGLGSGMTDPKQDK